MLKAGFDSIAILIYQDGAAERQAVGPHIYHILTGNAKSACGCGPSATTGEGCW